MIVDVALKLLQEQGLAAVTMRNVAQQLGVGAMTLYTYVEGQRGLHREMVRRGFEMLHGSCSRHSTIRETGGWGGGCHAYVDFAVSNPNLYKLMFDHPMDESDHDLLHGGFQHWLERVSDALAETGLKGEELEVEARRRAGRCWITLHGLAMLAIAGRLCVLHGDLDQVLGDLLPRVSPT